MSKKKNIFKLVESDLESSRLIFAVGDITDRLQKMAEDVAKMTVNDIMPISDDMKGVFGMEKAKAFDAASNEALDKALQSIRDAKDSISNEILRLQGKDVPDNDMGTDEGFGDDELEDEGLNDMADDEDGEIDIELDDDSDAFDDETDEAPTKKSKKDPIDDINVDDIFGGATSEEPMGRKAR